MLTLYHEVKINNKKRYKKPRHDGASHRFLIATVNNIKELFNFDFAYVPKSANREVDFRFSRNNEIVVVGFKLSANKLEDVYNVTSSEFKKGAKDSTGTFSL